MADSQMKIKQRCRTCLVESADVHSLHNVVKIFENVEMILSKLLITCATIQVFNNDLMPQQMCRLCVENACNSYKFRKQCETSYEILKKEAEENTKICNTTSNISQKNNSGLKVEKKETQCIAKSRSKKYLNCDSNSDLKVDLTKKQLKLHSTFECKKCSAKFSCISDLHEHLACHKNCKNIEKQFSTIVPVQQRTCDQCGKVFQYRTSMLKHKRKHGAPPNSCPYCNEIPETPMLLARHMQTVHEHLKNIVCTICNKTFFKEANLRLHMVIHTGVKKHTCEVCGISFALAGNLTAHRRLHTGEKPYTCSHCGRSFTQQAALRSHEAGHSNRRDYICKECGAAFSRAGALSNHCKRHTTVKPFICSMCGKAFTFSSERKRHMTIHTGDKNHICEVCGKRFNRSTNLKVHMCIHTGETSHVCCICGKGFIQAHCLRTHMNTHLPSLA